jgi:homoserine dehydrogenase
METRASAMRDLGLILVGFGRLARALVDLLVERPLPAPGGRRLRLRIYGLASGHHGCFADPRGWEPGELSAAVAQGGWPPAAGRVRSSYELIRTTAAQIMVETSPLNPFGGEPAVSHVRQALQRGLHVVTANKGPAACAYAELSALAAAQRRAFLFEAAVLGGAPLFRLARYGLHGAAVHGLRGLLNSTTSYLLDRIEEGGELAAALAEAQRRGLAETDPDHDLDGLDAATKLAVLVNVLLGGDLRPAEIPRRGIRELSAESVRAAKAEGRPLRLVARARREGGAIVASVAPEPLEHDDPLVGAGPRGNAVILETDLLEEFGVVQPRPSLRSTAFGLYSDLLELVGSRGG